MTSLLTFAAAFCRIAAAWICLAGILSTAAVAELPVLDLDGVKSAAARAALQTRYAALQTEYAIPSMAIQAQTVAGLERAKRQLLLTLENEGFRGAAISFSPGASTSPGTWRVTSGPPFLIGTIEVTADFEGRRAPEVEPFLQTRLSDHTGLPARGDSLSDIDASLEGILGDHGYPLARITKRALYLDASEPIVHVKIVLDPGDRGYFGKVRLKGFLGLDEARFLALAPFKEGDTFSAALLDDFRAAVDHTGLFKWVKAERSIEPDGFGQYQIELSAAISQQDFKVLHNVRHKVSFWITAAALFGLVVQVASRSLGVNSKAQIWIFRVCVVLVLAATGFLIQRALELVSLGAT